MIFTLTINTTNAAFELDAASEVAWILGETAQRLIGDDLPEPGTLLLLRDSNGNKVGACSMIEGDLR